LPGASHDPRHDDLTRPRDSPGSAIAGRAWVAGIDVAAAPARVHRHIGVVPQRNTLDRRLSVRDNLVFHGRYFGMRPAAARAAASRLCPAPGRAMPGARRSGQ
jgi:ABC-2 type transport system ATP-binding protein